VQKMMVFDGNDVPERTLIDREEFLLFLLWLES
jgi:hypothetical protein